MILGIIVTCQLMVVLDTTIVNIALPSMKSSLGFSEADLSWVLNAYTLAFGGLLIICGRAGDVFGRRRVLMFGLALFTIASLAGGLATSPGWLITARAVQGIGGAIISPAALALIMHNFDEGQPRAKAIGVYAAVSGAGTGAGLIAGGLLTAFVSWRWVLFVNIPIGIALLVLVPMFLGETERHPGRFGIAGAVTSTVSMVGLTYGFIHAASDGWSNGTTIGSFAAGIVFGIAFLIIETRVQQPIVPLRLFKDRNRSSAFAVRFLLIASMTGMMFFLTQFVQNVLGFSPLTAGFAFLPTTVATVVAARVAPKFIPKLGLKWLTVIGAVLVVAGMAWLTQITPQTGYLEGILGPMVLFGVGVAIPLVTLTMLAVAGVERKDAGAVSSVLNVMQQVGASLGLAILVTVFGAVSRQSPAAPAGSVEANATMTHAIAVSFEMASVFTIIIFLLSVLAIKVKPAPKPATA